MFTNKMDIGIGIVLYKQYFKLTTEQIQLMPNFESHPLLLKGSFIQSHLPLQKGGSYPNGRWPIQPGQLEI
jgi:hypothetical protein